MADSVVIKSLNAAALRDPRLNAHPARWVGGTLKISIFLNQNGDAIALDLSSGNENAIFMSAHLAPGRVLPAIDRKRYALGKSKNSNVNVPELEDRPLMRFHCHSLGQARDVLNYFAAL